MLSDAARKIDVAEVILRCATLVGVPTELPEELGVLVVGQGHPVNLLDLGIVTVLDDADLGNDRDRATTITVHGELEGDLLGVRRVGADGDRADRENRGGDGAQDRDANISDRTSSPSIGWCELTRGVNRLDLK